MATNLAALYWHAVDRAWTFHSAFDAPVAAHGLGQARFAIPVEGPMKLPLGTQEWTCFVQGVITHTVPSTM